MAKKTPATPELDLDQQRRMLVALKARTAAATRAVLAASAALTQLKRATRAAQDLGEEKMSARQAREITTPETNTPEDSRSLPPNGNGSTR